MSFPFKFGRRRMIAPKTCMRFKDYQQLSFPEAPSSGDYRPNAASALSQMYGNDQLGDCVIAWMAHAIGVFTGNATGTPVIFDSADIIKEYGAIGGYDPNDPSTDQGCDENTALDYWVSTGFIEPQHKISGFLSIDATNAKECASAIWLFENLMFGVALPDEWTHPIAAAPGFVWDGTTGDNPYASILALADAVLVTGDSANMVGEATATGAPVHVFEPSGGEPGKLGQAIGGLERLGAIRRFAGRIERFAYTPIDSSGVVAAEIARRFARARARAAGA